MAVTIIKKRAPGPKKPGALVAVGVKVERSMIGDADIRRMLDAARREVGDALRAKAQAPLASRYSMGPIVGDSLAASTYVLDTSATAQGYFRGRVGGVAPRIMRRLTSLWMKRVIREQPDTTPVQTQGGPLPR